MATEVSILKSMAMICSFLTIGLLLVACAQQAQQDIKWTPKPMKEEGQQFDIPNETEQSEEVNSEEPTKEEEDYSDLPVKEFKEGDFVVFPNLAKVDADGDPITYTFSEPLDENGTWQTKIGDAGEYKITIAASDAKGAESQKELLLVIKEVNRPPIITFDDTLTVKEGETVVLDPKVSDPEGGDVEVSYSGWTTKTSTETGFDDAGTYKVLIAAVDEKKAKATKEVTIVVENVNQLPKLESIDDISVKEGEKVKAVAKATDEDNDKVSLRFSKPLDAKGEWQTQTGDAGSYNVTVKANDGTDEVEETFAIEVSPLNSPPVLELEETEIVVEESELVEIVATADDPDGDKVTITYSGWMNQATKKTGYDDSGTYTVIVTAKDTKGASTEETVKITVKDKNRAPEIII